MEFCQRLLKETGVALAPGIGFGKEGDGYVRLCYANAMEKLKAGAERMDSFAKKYKEEVEKQEWMRIKQNGWGRLWI